MLLARFFLYAGFHLSDVSTSFSPLYVSRLKSLFRLYVKKKIIYKPSIKNKLKYGFDTSSKIVKYPIRHQVDFRDHCYVHVSGGTGGFGGPTFGGLGGNGGSVTLVGADCNLPSSGKYIAGPGEPCRRGFSRRGRSGEDLLIPVPLGTIIRDGTTKEIIADIDREGMEVLVAKGGLGGSEDTPIPYRPTDRERRNLFLELKTIADVGLIGFPNAGKSTLLSVISSVEPKIASYPFTTLRPEVGVVETKSGDVIRVADLPGLIAGAHKNLGLGFRFLRHIERTKFLIFLVDVNGFQLSASDAFFDPVESLAQLILELREYNSTLLCRPCLFVWNKVDLLSSSQLYQKMIQIENHVHYQNLLHELNVVGVYKTSTMKGVGIDEVVSSLGKWFEENKFELQNGTGQKDDIEFWKLD